MVRIKWNFASKEGAIDTDSQEFLFDNYVVYAIDGLDTVRIF